jgi:hypothetical protein
VPATTWKDYLLERLPDTRCATKPLCRTKLICPANLGLILIGDVDIQMRLIIYLDAIHLQEGLDTMINALNQGKNMNEAIADTIGGMPTRALRNGFLELRNNANGRAIVKAVAGKFEIYGKFQGHAMGDTANSAIINNIIKTATGLGPRP